MPHPLRPLAALTLGAALTLPAFAADLGGATASTVTTNVAESFKQAEQAIRKFRVAPGFKVETVAVDPQLKNAVAFAFDEKGNIYTSETGRYRSSTLDIRSYMSWYDDDLASRTVDDRISMIKKHMPDDWQKLGVESETIRFLRDVNGDGRMDESKVFATGFTNLLDGIASGVMARRGEVWFTNIPDLVKLLDKDGDGVAESREVLHHGYGVHFSLTGHDLHGLAWGPDGRIYFTVGDRGAHVTSREGKVFNYPDEGVCFRMNPDGSNLEVFATGLRNPQELAFDEFGNLFTGENDCDHGDMERWLHIVQGADYGWRIGYQFSEQNPGGAWMSERIWWTNFTGRAAYAMPPFSHIDNGPSGLTYYPGTGLSDSYKGMFFLTHFKGVDNVSGIKGYTFAPKGASFELAKMQEIIWNTLPTDVDFSPDGYLHFVDWVHGWPKSDKGRIYRLVPDKLDPRAQETAKLLREGMAKRSTKDLVKLLANPDMRVRLEAQYELAARPKNGKASEIKSLVDTALKSPNRHARIHAIWAMRQIGRRSYEERMAEYLQSKALVNNKKDKDLDEAFSQLLPLLKDKDTVILEVAPMMFAESHFSPGAMEIIKLLTNSVSKIRAEAGIALATYPGYFQPPLDEFKKMLIDAQINNDPTLRHSTVMALKSLWVWLPINGTSSHFAVTDFMQHTNAGVRMGAVLAFRQLKEPSIGNFVKDADPLVALEAARAINDVPIEQGLPALAALIGTQGETPKLDAKAASVAGMLNEDYARLVIRPMVRRALNANFRLGEAKHAQALATFALAGVRGEDVTVDVSQELQAEALLMLGQWGAPSPRDKVIGLWRPLPKRDAQPAIAALQPVLPNLIKEPTAVGLAAIRASAELGMTSASDLLATTLRAGSTSADARVDILRALARLKAPQLTEALQAGAVDSDVNVRKEATRLSASANATAAAPELAKILQNGSLPEKQTALAALATIPGTVADEIIYGQLRLWVENKAAAPELYLDILEACEVRADERIKLWLGRYRETISTNDVLGEYRVVLHGGNAEAGKKIFVERAEASCVRCHRINNEGGEVGPDLSHVGKTHDREYLLKAMLLPNAEIATGFESLMVELHDGAFYAGVLKSENDQEIVLNSPEDGLVTVAKSKIKTRQKGLSGMPEGLEKILSKRDLRDLVEYLSSLK